MVKDLLVGAVLGAIKTEGVKLASSLIQRGADLLEKRLNGEATDEEILQWLRDAQDGAA